MIGEYCNICGDYWNHVEMTKKELAELRLGEGCPSCNYKPVKKTLSK